MYVCAQSMLVTKCKFEYLISSEAKQTETEFGTEKSLLQGQAKNRWIVLKKTQTHGLFGEVFIGKIWGEGFRMWGFLLIDWWCSNRVVLQGSCAQPEVTILHLGECLSFCRRTQRQCCVYYLRRNQDLTPKLTLLFLDCSYLVSAFSSFPDQQLFESALWNSREI